MDRHQMALRGKLGAYVLHSTHDSREITEAARAGFLAKFERQVDPDRVLAPEERRRRALAARNAHMMRLALRSAEVRRKKKKRGRKEAGP